LKQNKINKEMSYYLYIHNIYLYQYHDTKPNPINIDWILGLTPTLKTNCTDLCRFVAVVACSTIAIVVFTAMDLAAQL